MSKAYRSESERKLIIRACIAEGVNASPSEFNLSEGEEVNYRAKSARIVDELARESSNFRQYYALPSENPFYYVIAISAFVVIACLTFATYIYFHAVGTPPYPLYAAFLSITAVAAGWSIGGWMTHRNTVRQNTNNMIFARFSQAPFGEAMHRFHWTFDQPGSSRVTFQSVQHIRSTCGEDGRRAAASVTYLLNYFEFIASGVLRGDLDQEIVRQNLRGVVCFYYDKCEPYIKHYNNLNPRVFERLIKLRTHYREP